MYNRIEERDTDVFLGIRKLFYAPKTNEPLAKRSSENFLSQIEPKHKELANILCGLADPPQFFIEDTFDPPANF